MGVDDYYSPKEREAFLRSVAKAEAKLQRQEIQNLSPERPDDRQKGTKVRGRPRKFDPQALLDAYETECLLSDWGDPSPTLSQFCEKHGVSQSLFRKIRQLRNQDDES